MNEIHREPTAEQQKQPENDGRYEQWMKDHPETAIAPEDLRECGPDIAEFEELLALFESTHSLTELHSIIDLTTAEAPKHPVREPAHLFLSRFIAKLSVLKNKTNIMIVSPAEYERLDAAYKRLSRAVGIINNGRVDHNR
jgi:hypothetical protein